jgi:hypothetical protein
MDKEALMVMAREMGRVIAEEIKKVQQPIIIKQSVGDNDAHHEKDVSVVEIDESLIDVGIGEVEAFVKGEDSAEIAKEEVRTDKKFSKSKDRLRALKKGQA